MPTNGDEVIYASGVRPKTALILRRFAVINHITFSKLMDILAHVVSGYRTDAMFSGRASEINPLFGSLDALLTDYMEKNMPEEYRRIPVFTRIFGRAFKPLTKKDLEEIERELAKEEEGIPEQEVPEVEKKDVE